MASFHDPVHDGTGFANRDADLGLKSQPERSHLATDIPHRLFCSSIRFGIIGGRILGPCDEILPQLSQRLLQHQHRRLAVSLEDYVAPAYLLDVLYKLLDYPGISKSICIDAV